MHMFHDTLVSFAERRVISMRFYNQMFEGTVILRANTGGTAAKYTVGGVWSPNR